MQCQMIALLTVVILLSSQTTGSFIPENECINYTILHEASRSKFFSNYTANVSDSSLTGWFTFNGSAGKQISTSCVPTNRCGTLVPGWMAGTHPGVVEGVVKRSACFSMRQLCCMVSVSMRVKNCSGFYVYKLDTMPSFNLKFRLCGDGVKGSIPLLQAESENVSENDNGCLSYKTLNEDDRAVDYFSYHTMKCDANLPQVWYRFTGRAGTVMPTQCVTKMHCGTLSPGWLNGKHPSMDEGMVERMICFTKDDECCFWYSRVLVRNCSDFIVYRFGQFPTARHFCSLRYCGAGRAGCKDKNGNVYDVWQTWNPNPLFTCKCAPNFQVLCTETETGCWDFHGNAYADRQEWLSNSKTKCGCLKGKITCTNLSRPACTDKSSIVREHGTNWFSGACFNCTCSEGLINCLKYHVTVQYGLFGVETVGNCMPCRQPSEDIIPTGSGTVSACQVFFQLKESNELFLCSSGDFIRKRHVCNGITECPDGSDEAQCQDVVCRDEEGQVLVLKDVWKVTDCITCRCHAGLLKCKRTLQVNFPGQYNAYVPFTESCEQPTCNVLEFIRDRRESCQAIETTKDGRILLEGDTWQHQGCKFLFTGVKTTQGCPSMRTPLCYLYNGAVCCARKCPVLSELASQMRWNMTECPEGLQLRAGDDVCDTPSPNCLQGNDCEQQALCQDEEGIAYFDGATWSVGDCTYCRCDKGIISCSRRIMFITSYEFKTEHCNQTGCNVAAFLKTNKRICKACIWRNKTLPDGHRWKENGVDFFCSSEKQRVRPGCYLETGQVRCTGAFLGIQNSTLILEDRLYVCESGDEIRSLNDRCNQRKDCNDDSDERDCAQYVCPFHTKFSLYWERTALERVVQRNCSEIDPNLGGHFTSRCSSDFGLITKWSHKEGCYCEKSTLLQEFGIELSSVNLTDLLNLSRRLIGEGSNFTNKDLFLDYLIRFFKTGASMLSPINQSNEMVALNFSQIFFNAADDRDLFLSPSNSFCSRAVTTVQLWNLKYDVRNFACRAPNFTAQSLAFCRRIWFFPFLVYRAADDVRVPVLSAYHLRPGLTQFWLRQALRLRIDPNQLSSGGQPPGYPSLLPRNFTSEVNGSNSGDHFQSANCTWIRYDVNGTLTITAREIKDEGKEQKAIIQGYLELTLSSISIVAVIICLIILSCLRIRNSERIFVHKNLLLSLCLVYIVMILDTFVFTNRKQTPKLCSAMAVIQHLTHTAIFSWMLVEGIHLYIKLVKVFSVKRLYITYIIIGWGLPAIMVGLIAAIRPETYDMSKTYYKDVMCGSLKLPAEIMRDRCWLHDGEWLYKAPILTILLINLAIFVVLLKVIFTKISAKYPTDNVEKAKRGVKSVAALLPLLGATWLLGFVVQWSEVLLYLFIILNSTQGLAFCIFHSLLDDQIMKSLVNSIRKVLIRHVKRYDRSSIASTSTQLSPGSLHRKEDFKQRGRILISKSLDTKL